jgi:type IV pilus assembly protein PilN
MYVKLNLATKPLVSHRRFMLGSAALGIVGALLFLILGVRFYSLRQADAQLRGKTDKLQREMNDLMKQRKDLDAFFAQQENAGLEERGKFIKSVIEARSFNWTQMFMDLEHILPSGVRVISIEPKQASGRVEVKLTVGATSDDAKLKFLHALEESKQFTHTELIHEGPPQSNNQSTDQKIVQLTVSYSRT